MTYGKYLRPDVKYKKVAGPTKLSQETEEIFRRVAASLKANPEPVREIKPRGERGPYRKQGIKTGMIFGNLIVRGKAAVKRGVKPSLRERWRCECLAACDWKPNKTCHNAIIVPKYYLTRKGNPKTHCGCQFETLKSRHAREYRIYHMMHQRCMNPKHESYEHYKSRGIGIYEPWQKTNADGFDLWLEEVGKCPTPLHSLDRIDNRKGYEPNNLKWSTATEQRMNQGDLIGGKSVEEIAEMNMTEEEWIAHARVHGYL